jgi:type IV secretion system protein VirD4
MAGGAFAIAGITMSAAGLILYLVVHFQFDVGRRDTHGASRWANRRDLRRLIHASKGGRGIVLGWLGRWRLLVAPAEDNVLVFGVQRSGKTSTLAIPTLLEWTGAAVATSTKEELVTLTARHRAAMGPVHVFAPLDRDTNWITRLGLSPVTWNPLDEAEDAGAAAELADIFTADGKQSPSPHWYLSASNLLTGLSLLEHAEGGDLRAVLRRINETPVLGYLALAAGTSGDAAEILRGFASTPEREAGSIISTARSSLSLWLDPRIAAATTSASGRGLDLDRLLASSGTLYLVAPVEDAERCRLLFSALLSSLLRRATHRARSLGGVLQPRLLLALDEAANFARVPRLTSYVSTGPGQGIQSLLCFHDLAQLEAGYGHDQARTIWNNCRARLLLPGQGDLRTLELFSHAIGNETVAYDVISRGRGGPSTLESRLSRPLVSVDALRRSEQPVLIYADRPPARLRARRWDQVPKWRDAIAAARGSPDPLAA